MTHDQMSEVQWLWNLNGEHPAIFKWLVILMAATGIIDRGRKLFPHPYGPPSPYRTIDAALADRSWDF